MVNQEISRFIPMEMTLADAEFNFENLFSSNDKAEIFQNLVVRGCFLDKKTLSLHMFQEKLSV